MVLGKMAAVVIGLATIALFTRYLGPEGFGHYRTVLTVLAVAAICSDLGLQMVVLREVSRPDQDAGQVLGAGIALRMILNSLAVIGGGIVALLLPYPEIVKIGVFIAAPYYIMLQSSFLLGAFFLKHLRQDQLMAGEVLGGVVMLGGLSLAVLLDGGVLATLVAMVVGGLAQFALLWLWELCSNLVDDCKGGVSSVMFNVTMKRTRHGGGYRRPAAAPMGERDGGSVVRGAAIGSTADAAAGHRGRGRGVPRSARRTRGWPRLTPRRAQWSRARA